MTSGEIRAKIRYYEGLIDEYNREKLQLEKDLDELDRLKAKVAGLQTSFGDRQALRQQNLAALAAMPQRNRIYPVYCAGMQELLTGQMFSRSYEGLSEAGQKVSGKMREVLGKIDNCESKRNARSGSGGGECVMDANLKNKKAPYLLSAILLAAVVFACAACAQSPSEEQNNINEETEQQETTEITLPGSLFEFANTDLQDNKEAFEEYCTDVREDGDSLVLEVTEEQREALIEMNQKNIDDILDQVVGSCRQKS